MDLFVLVMSAIMIPMCAFTILRVYEDMEERKAFLEDLHEILDQIEEVIE